MRVSSRHAYGVTLIRALLASIVARDTGQCGSDESLIIDHDYLRNLNFKGIHCADSVLYSPGSSLPPEREPACIAPSSYPVLAWSPSLPCSSCRSRLLRVVTVLLGHVDDERVQALSVFDKTSSVAVVCVQRRFACGELS
ncbi:hypothetical protein C8Q74DRAFT_335687 [Fomes fomentarius]|nr:hypothetical protein C8Q74DRAFT_335687 [Fomes fomentarius]